jgi:hypothetical protein
MSLEINQDGWEHKLLTLGDVVEITVKIRLSSLKRLSSYLIDHKDDIISNVNDFGELRGTLEDFFGKNQEVSNPFYKKIEGTGNGI